MEFFQLTSNNHRTIYGASVHQHRATNAVTTDNNGTDVTACLSAMPWNIHGLIKTGWRYMFNYHRSHRLKSSFSERNVLSWRRLLLWWYRVLVASWIPRWPWWHHSDNFQQVPSWLGRSGLHGNSSSSKHQPNVSLVTTLLRSTLRVWCLTKSHTCSKY